MLPASTLRHRARQWHWLVLVFAIFFAAGCWWGGHRLSPVAALRWQAFPVGHVPTATKGVMITDYPRDVFEAMAQEIGSPLFLASALKGAGQPTNDQFLAQRLKTDIETAPHSLNLRLTGYEAPIAQAILESISRQAPKSISARFVGEEQDIQNQLALATENLNAAKARMDQFNSSNQVFDLDKETSDIQRQQSETALKIEVLQTELQATEARMKSLSDEVARQNPALNAAHDALQNALSRYTDEHPRVRELRAAVAKLEQEGSAAPDKASADIVLSTNNPTLSLSLNIIEHRANAEGQRKQAEALEKVRTRLSQRLESLALLRHDKQQKESSVQKAQAILARLQNQLNPMNNSERTTPVYAIGSPRFLLDPVPIMERIKSGVLTGALSGLTGSFIFALIIILRESRRTTIQAAHELEQASDVPTIAQLGHLREMSKNEEQRWALETFSVLKGRAEGDGQNSLIYGFTAANHSEGTSTCVRLLADAAKRQGYFTLVLDLSRKTPKKRTTPSPSPVATSAAPERSSENVDTELAQVTGYSVPDRVMHLNSLETAWDWQFRKQFQNALVQWKQAENLAVFVDLPPYSTDEGVVLAEKLPNLVWCCRCGQSDLSETSSFMNTLKNSHRNLIGTIFNQARVNRSKKANEWMRAAAAIFIMVFAAGRVHSQDATNAIPDTMPIASGLSVSEQPHLAPWQERLTLGPGDVLDISLYGVAESARPGLAIGPDGRLNYLQARDIMAADLTVDELRATLEQALAKYHLAPKVVINPAAYNSKKYYILGNVMRKGGYLLDRPTTVIEAIAKSGGFVSALQQQNVSTLVDLERSFLVRKNDDGSFGKVSVNMQSLFLRGDLSQNIPLAPGDYLFFPETGRQEIYVVGEVRSQGLYPFTTEITALGAVAAKGGYTERAWKSKILVIRGSLDNPQTFVIDGGDILKGKGTDFQLQNRDIVYVHRKPWAKAQEILGYGVTSFFRAAVIGYTGRNVGPFIKSPIVK